MLDSLQFVRGTVARENKINPALNHFHIESGRITGINDTYTISAPIATDITATPKGPDFAKAIERAKSTINLYMDNGKMVVKSGRMTVRIDCTTDPFPLVQPEGQTFWLAPDFVEQAKRLLPFVNKDNAKAWATGLLLEGPALTATDNVSIVQAYLGEEYSPPIPCVIPEATIRELVRIKEPPRWAAVSLRSITFYYGEGDRFICSRLMPNDWPDINKFFAQQQELVPLSEDFWEGVDTLLDFANDQGAIIFESDRMRTSKDEKSGAVVEGDFPAKRGAISAKYMKKLRGLINMAGFDSWPQPMQFRGEKLRGVIAGMHV